MRLCQGPGARCTCDELDTPDCESKELQFVHVSFVSFMLWAYRASDTTTSEFGMIQGAFGGFLVVDLSLRCALVVSLLVHEWSHLIAAALLFREEVERSEIFTWFNVMGGLTVRQWGDFMTPLRPVKEWPHVHVPHASVDKRANRVVQLAGLFTSGLAGAAAGLFLLVAEEAHTGAAWGAAAGVIVCTIAATTSDLIPQKVMDGVFRCGNWGELRVRLAEEFGAMLPAKSAQYLSNLMEVMELRGAQAGGFLSFGIDASGTTIPIPSRTVKTKRGIFIDELLGAYRSAASSAWWSHYGSLKPQDVVFLQGHSRFGTSSVSDIRSTAPLQWAAPRPLQMWNFEDGKWKSKLEKQYVISVTHNGDIDGFKPHNEMLSTHVAVEWLQRVLQQPNPSKGLDSIVIAGCLELLHGQGNWFNAVRGSFVINVAKHHNTDTPDVTVFEMWAAAFEDVWAEYKNFPSPHSPAGQIDRATTELVCKFMATLKENTFRGWLTPVALPMFIQSTLIAFLHHDMHWCLKYFVRHFEGTAAITASVSSRPTQVSIGVNGQPITVAVSQIEAHCAWASVTTAIHSEGLTDCLQMDDQNGEIVELCLRDLSPEEVRFQKYIPVNGTGKLFLRGEALDESYILDSNLFARRLAPLSGSSLRNKTLAVISQPEMLPEDDAVSYDISCIPATLAAIEQEWSLPQSGNFQIASAFSKLLLPMCHRWTDMPKPVREIDILVIGIENSLWLGQQFIADLQMVCPHLRCVAISSNRALGIVQNNIYHVRSSNFALSKEEIVSAHVVLAVSESGSTYPTVWAARMLCQCGAKVFAMVGNPNTALTNVVDSKCSDPIGRTLLTLSGLRPSESATLTTIAMQHTLTKFMCHIVTCLVNSGTSESPLGCTLKTADIQDVNRMVACLVEDAEDICGVTVLGERCETDTHRHLKAVGLDWSSHVTEGYWAMVLAGAYVLITVFAIGSAPVSALVAHLFPLSDVGKYVASFIDSWIYILLGPIFLVVQRLLTGRRLFVRYSPKNVVVADTTMVYKLVRAYISKLFALAYRFATVSVNGQDPLDHFVHEYQHLTHNDVLIAAGLPDGRVISNISAQNATLMALQQARFRSKGCVEMVTIGHDTWHDPGLVRHHVALNSSRPRFLCEFMLKLKRGTAPSAILMGYSNLATPEDTKYDGSSWEDAEAMEAVAKILEEDQPEFFKFSGAKLAAQQTEQPVAVALVMRIAEAAGISVDERRVDQKLAGSRTSFGQVLQIMRNPPLRISNDRYDLDVLSGSMGIVGVGDPNGDSADILCSGPNGVHYGILCAYMQRHESIKEEGMHKGRDWSAIDMDVLASEKHQGDVIGQHLSHAPVNSPLGSPLLAPISPSTEAENITRQQELIKENNSMFDHQSVEMLYESRVAATNRLMSFFVIFHQVVLPVCRLPFLNFPIDRTASRLRVASTPAPIPMNARFARAEAYRAKIKQSQSDVTKITSRGSGMFPSRQGSGIYAKQGSFSSRQNSNRGSFKGLRKAHTITSGEELDMYGMPPPQYSPLQSIDNRRGSDQEDNSSSVDDWTALGTSESYVSEVPVPLDIQRPAIGNTFGGPISPVSSPLWSSRPSPVDSDSLPGLDEHLAVLFARYDFEDSGFIESKTDVKMLAANLSFKLGLSNRLVTDEMLDGLPDSRPQGWTQAEVNAWYISNFGAGSATSPTSPLGVKPVKKPLESAAKKAARLRLKAKAAKAKQDQMV